MIEVEQFEWGIRAVDAAKNQVEIEIDDWEVGGEPLDIGREVDFILCGSATEIRAGKAGVLVESDQLDTRRTVTLGDSIELDGGRHLLQLSSTITVFIRTDTSFKINLDLEFQETRIIFETASSITLGIRTDNGQQVDAISIGDSINSLADCISHFGTYFKSGTPDRSYPSMRPNLPPINIGQAEGITPNLSKPNSQVTIRVPRNYDSIFSIAPLSYYVSALVKAETRDNAILQIGSSDWLISDGSNISTKASKLLMKVFYLDCLIREFGPNKFGIKERVLLEDFDMDFEKLACAELIDRLPCYKSIQFEQIADKLPSWPFSTYLRPTAEHIPALPYLLNRMSMIIPAQGEQVPFKEVLNGSLGRVYRANSTEELQSNNPPIQINPLGEDLSEIKAWMADGLPIEGFKLSTNAIINRQNSRADSGDTAIKVALVLNDSSMKEETSEAATSYETTSRGVTINLDIRQDLSRDEMLEVFSTDYDFLHYIGHCHNDGLECIDGNLDISKLERSNVKSFLLNACLSYHIGRKLIRKGSFVGGVTVGKVLDKQARMVGVTFARLLMQGYTFERAMYYSRRRTIQNRFYSIIGDGNFVLTQPQYSIEPSVVHINDITPNRYSIKFSSVPITYNGAVQQEWLNSEPSLMGNLSEHEVSCDDLRQIIKATEDPVLFNDSFYWPEEFLMKLN